MTTVFHSLSISIVGKQVGSSAPYSHSGTRQGMEVPPSCSPVIWNTWNPQCNRRGRECKFSHQHLMPNAEVSCVTYSHRLNLCGPGKCSLPETQKEKWSRHQWPLEMSDEDNNDSSVGLLGEFNVITSPSIQDRPSAIVVPFPFSSWWTVANCIYILLFPFHLKLMTFPIVLKKYLLNHFSKKCAIIFISYLEFTGNVFSWL